MIMVLEKKMIAVNSAVTFAYIRIVKREYSVLGITAVSLYFYSFYLFAFPTLYFFFSFSSSANWLCAPWTYFLIKTNDDLTALCASDAENGQTRIKI